MPPPMIGGHVTGPLLITRSDRFVVAVRHVVAFPVGVEVEVEPASSLPETRSGPPPARPGRSGSSAGLNKPRRRLTPAALPGNLDSDPQRRGTRRERR